MMVKHIFLKELYGYLHNNRMLLSISVILILMVLNGMVFIVTHLWENNIYREMTTINQEKLRHNTSGDYALKEFRAAFFGKELESHNTLFDLVFLKQQIIKPPSKLAVLSEAEAGLLPDGISATFFSVDNPQRFKSGNPFLGSFFSMDWTNILIYFISFICICFAYNAFSGERGDGTLKLMLSNNISRWQIIMGKWLSILTVIIIPLILGIIINLIIITLSRQLSIGFNELSIILFFILGAILFISLNILLSFIISLFTSTSSHSLGVCLICWIILAVAIPDTAWLLAKKTVPVETMDELSMLEEERINEETKGCSWSWDYRWANNPPNPEVLERAECSNISTRVYNEIWERYRNDIINQTNFAINLSKISPFGVFRFFGETLSDRGFTGYRNFYKQFVNYHASYKNFIKEKDNADKESYNLIWNELFNAQTFMSNKKVSYEEIPQFQYRSLSFVEAFKNSVWDVLILALWCIVLFLIAFIAFVKYDVR